MPSRYTRFNRRERPRIVRTEWQGENGQPLPDALMHSAQCDSYFSAASPEPGGVVHTGCRCWCHNAGLYYSMPEPEPDYTLPPEYITSADVFIKLPAPGNNRDSDLVPHDSVATNLCASRFPNRSRRELEHNRCDTCGDALNKCECAE